MWVSRYELDRLKERLERMEKWKEKHECDLNFTVYSPDEDKYVQGFLCGGWWEKKRAEISIKDVVKRLMERAGIELRYRKGLPEGVDIYEEEKTKKPANSKG